MKKFDKKEIPDTLVDSIKSEKCGVFVGSGLSIKAGLPSWKGLLSELINLADRLPFTSSKQIKEYKDLLKSNDTSKHLVLAADLKEILADEFRKFIYDKFSKNCPAPVKVHKKLLEIPFKFYLTTNYDNLLETAYVSKYKNIPPVFTFKQPSEVAIHLWDSSFFILKLHGDANGLPKEIVLSDLDYRSIIYNESGYQSLLHALFTANTILFLGTSIADIDLRLLLAFIHNSFHGGGPTHYALIPEDEKNITETKRWHKDYNIQFISFSRDADFSQIDAFLDSLKAKVGSIK